MAAQADNRDSQCTLEHMEDKQRSWARDHILNRRVRILVFTTLCVLSGGYEKEAVKQEFCKGTFICFCLYQLTGGMEDAFSKKYSGVSYLWSSVTICNKWRPVSEIHCLHSRILQENICKTLLLLQRGLYVTIMKDFKVYWNTTFYSYYHALY